MGRPRRRLRAHAAPEVTPATREGRLAPPLWFLRRSRIYLPSQTFTLAWFLAIQACAALSGSTCLPAIIPATVFWSAFDHLKRLTTPTAGEPLVANFLLMNLRSV